MRADNGNGDRRPPPCPVRLGKRPFREMAVRARQMAVWWNGRLGLELQPNAALLFSKSQLYIWKNAGLATLYNLHTIPYDECLLYLKWPWCCPSTYSVGSRAWQSDLMTRVSSQFPCPERVWTWISRKKSDSRSCSCLSVLNIGRDRFFLEICPTNVLLDRLWGRTSRDSDMQVKAMRRCCDDNIRHSWQWAERAKGRGANSGNRCSCSCHHAQLVISNRLGRSARS